MKYRVEWFWVVEDEEAGKKVGELKSQVEKDLIAGLEIRESVARSKNAKDVRVYAIR